MDPISKLEGCDKNDTEYLANSSLWLHGLSAHKVQLSSESENTNPCLVYCLSIPVDFRATDTVTVPDTNLKKSDM
jgi:hypothetical protein